MIEGWRRRIGLLDAEQAPPDYLDPRAMDLSRAWPQPSAVEQYMPQGMRDWGQSVREAQGKPTLFGKALGLLGLDDSGKRAATSWGDAAKSTMFLPGEMVQGIADSAHNMMHSDGQSYHTSPDPEDRARAAQYTGDVFNVAGALPMGSALAGRVAPGVAREAAPRATLADVEAAQAHLDALTQKRDALRQQVELGRNTNAAMAARVRSQEEIINGLHRKENGLLGDIAREGATNPENFSGITAEGNMGQAARHFMPSPGQDPVPGVTRMDGSKLYSNPDEAAAAGLVGTRGQQQTYYRGLTSPDHFGPYPKPGVTPDQQNVFSASSPQVAGFHGGKVVEVQNRFANPMKVDANGAMWSGVEHEGNKYTLDRLADKARQRGHDGLHVTNVQDPMLSDVSIALQRGTVYDPKTGNLLWSNPDEAAALAGITAYHGSPWDFEQFKTPAFFTRDENIARQYKTDGGGADNMNGAHKLPSREQLWAAPYLDEARGNRGSALALVDQDIAKFSADYQRSLAESSPHADMDKSMLDMARSARQAIENGVSGGHMYEVQLPHPEKDYAGDQRAAFEDAKKNGHKVISFYGGSEIAALDPTAIKMVRKFSSNPDEAAPLAGLAGGQHRQQPITESFRRNGNNTVEYTPDMLREFERMYNAGVKFPTIAERLGVSLEGLRGATYGGLLDHLGIDKRPLTNKKSDALKNEIFSHWQDGKSSAEIARLVSTDDNPMTRNAVIGVIDRAKKSGIALRVNPDEAAPLAGLLNAGAEKQGSGATAGRPSGVPEPIRPPSGLSVNDRLAQELAPGPSQGQGSHGLMPHDSSLALRRSVAEEIAKRIAEADLRLNHFGLRAESGREFRNGESMPQSRVWDDGVPHPEETLNGTSTLGLPYDQTITHADVADAMRALGNYDGDSLVLVGGKTAEHGVDAGESVLRGATALGQWPRYKDGNALFSNSKDGASLAGITAYHGSPHDFDRFSMDKIGTGEGAQAYGHGLYFAEKEGVAKAYKDQINHNAPGHYAAQRFLEDAGGDRQKALQVVQGHLDRHKANRNDNGTWSMEDAAARLSDPQWNPGPGHMYEVRINADPEHFLDWDKPLSQQSEKARAALNEHFSSDPIRSRDLKDDVIPAYLMRNAHGPEVTQALREAGIPGIKYLDQGSRTAGEGSRNYVVFNDQIISIVKKYGWAGAAAMLGMSADDMMSQAHAQTPPEKPDPYKTALQMQVKRKALGLKP